MKIKRGNGFTLVELMITVAIVSILAAVSIPAYQNYVLKAQVSEAIVLMGGVKIAILEKYSQTGDLSRVMEDGGVGLGSSLQLKGRYSTVWTIQDGKVMALMKGPASSDTFKNTWITLEPHEDERGNLTWTCDGWMVPKEWLPSTCQG